MLHVSLTLFGRNNENPDFPLDIKAMGGTAAAIGILILYTTAQLDNGFGDWWLSYWSTNVTRHSLKFWILICILDAMRIIRKY